MSQQIPSNKEILKTLDQEIAHLDKVEADPSVGYKGERVIEDVKRIIEDEKTLIKEKNSGDNIQHLAEHSYLMACELANDNSFKDLFESWGSLLASSAKSGNWQEITQVVGKLANDLRDTESFVLLLSELQKTLKLLLAQRVEQATNAGESLVKKAASGIESAAQQAQKAGLIEKDSKDAAASKAHIASEKTEEAADKARSTVHQAAGISSSSAPVSDTKYESRKEKQRKKLLKQLDATLRALSQNSTWRLIVSKSKEAGNTAQAEVINPAAQAISAIAESPRAQQVLSDFKATLQGLVGADISVEPFFENTQKAIESITSDPEYATLFCQVQDQLAFIAERPVLLDDNYTQQNLQNLWSKFEAKLESLRNNEYLLNARQESEKLINAIMHDPNSAKLVNDIKKLLAHLRSFKPGFSLDPTVLSEMRGVLVPLLLEHLTAVPVPGIVDVADTALGKFEYQLDNLHIAADQLIPENIKIKFKYDLDAHPRSLSYNNQRLKVLLKAKGVHLSLRDVAWSYQRKSTPHLHDCGHVDLCTAGDGVVLRLKMEVSRLSESHENELGQQIQNKEVFKVLDSCAHLDNWHVTFSDSKHDKLYELLSTLFSDRIKNHIQELIVGKLRSFTDTFNQKVWILYNEAQLKGEEAKFWAENARHNISSQIDAKKEEAKDAILHSDAAEALKEAAKEKGKEALFAGYQKIKEAPSIGDAVSNIGSTIKDAVQNSDLATSLKEKAGIESAPAQQHEYNKIPASFRPVDPFPAASFVSSSGEAEPLLGNVPPAAKLPLAAFDEKEDKSRKPAQ